MTASSTGLWSARVESQSFQPGGSVPSPSVSKQSLSFSPHLYQLGRAARYRCSGCALREADVEKLLWGARGWVWGLQPSQKSWRSLFCTQSETHTAWGLLQSCFFLDMPQGPFSCELSEAEFLSPPPNSKEPRDVPNRLSYQLSPYSP